MLTNLSINNIVLIDRMEMGLQDGFCVLTGETGAGKSILLDALSLAMGARAEARLVRQGEKQGSVTAEFDISDYSHIRKLLEENDLEAPDDLILRRVIQADGKSRALVNDSPVSLTFLKKLSEHLVEIHGQHEQTGLLDESSHRSILDRYGKLEKKLDELKAAYHELQQYRKTLEEIKQKADKIKADEDYLKHVLKELNQLDPQPNEEDRLAEQRRLLMNSEKLAETLAHAMQEVTGQKNVAESLRTAQRILYRSTLAGDAFAKAIDALDKAANESEEAMAQLEKLTQEINPDNASLEQVEERLFALKDAARKYQRPVNELKDFAKEISLQLEMIDGGGKNIGELEKQVDQKKMQYRKLAKSLFNDRKKVAAEMEEAVASELAPLKLGNSEFKVDLQELPEEQWSEKGMEKISFLVKTNTGSPFGAISKIASGGELSRFMLALKVVLLDTKSCTMIFDEIDAGIGGAVADAVGKRLAKLGRKQQVLVVTHQPQVAAYGSHHFVVSKQVKDGKTTTTIRELDEKQKKEELARMLAGSKVTNEARAAALALMEAK